jgi:hypothetical protein
MQIRIMLATTVAPKPLAFAKMLTRTAIATTVAEKSSPLLFIAKDLHLPQTATALAA